MIVTEMLSDLTALYIADPKAAIALVNAHKPEASGSTAPVTGIQEDDADLRRAKDLVQLHAEVKVAHADGADRELNEARNVVAKVLRDL
ncbi:hypothetical protein LTR62_006505 [Meristemomyces frigidus]|uniref:Uncharacterized protein n=1 Tax=Meristemomyces frigidus TaxID=1508187 RepID=A0AAN7TBW6_9PEZI|nr:hypothetical protein LTR62_006505 [Meristemomyces frigidus]